MKTSYPCGSNFHGLHPCTYFPPWPGGARSVLERTVRTILITAYLTLRQKQELDEKANQSEVQAHACNPRTWKTEAGRSTEV